MSRKKIIIVGAGPGGLTSAMLLAHRGFDVTVFEKQDYVGGRNSAVKLGDFTFDLGPTFLMMAFHLEEVFKLAGRKISDYLDMREIDPLYRLVYNSGEIEFFPSRDKEFMRKQIEKYFPGNWEGYQQLFMREKAKYDKIEPCLRVPYQKYSDFLTKRFFRALPVFDMHFDLFSYLDRFFTDDNLKISFTFQAKYLGMSPWQCPATFSIINYVEHGYGIWHTIGGLNQISAQMAKAAEEDGAKIHTSTGVKKVVVRNNRAVGVDLENGERVDADYVILNADFAHAMDHLVAPEDKLKYIPEKLDKMKYSCSTFMLYLGMDKVYDIPHHNILFADDYKKNVNDMTVDYKLSDDPSIYVQNACITDPTLAPEGKSTLYVLVPAPNRLSGIDWSGEAKDIYREKALVAMEKRAGLTDVRRHIVEEKIVTPDDWESDKYVYRGATFNLGHNLSQMLIWRPHNKFEEFGGCYLVGGGTHPGSGLPTIVESGRISTELLLKEEGMTLDSSI